MKTIKVKPWGDDQGDFVLINEDDFDANFHEKLEDPADAKKAGIADLRAALTEKGIEFPADAKKADLQALLDAATQA
jgi:hypothetical protein